MDKNNEKERDISIKNDAKWRKGGSNYEQFDSGSMEAFVKKGRDLYDSKTECLPIISKMSTTKYNQKLRP